MRWLAINGYDVNKTASEKHFYLTTKSSLQNMPPSVRLCCPAGPDFMEPESSLPFS
jgi:hypothetical protein